MPGDYCCFLCSETIFHSAKKKHLFSKKHLSDIHNGILRAKTILDTWISLYDEGKKTLRDCIPPIPLTKKTGGSFIVCIPCKHIGETIKGHTCTNESMKDNVEYYKKILKQDIPKETRVSIETQTDGVPVPLGVASDPKEIQKLKKQIELLEKDNDKLEGKSEKAGLLCDALCYAMNYIKEQDREIYNSIMDNMEDDYNGVMQYLKN